MSVLVHAGLWARYNDATWAKLHSYSAQALAIGDLDGNGRDDLLVNFGASGLWARYNNATWTKLHNNSSIGLIAADLDGDGKDELVVDFSNGLWIRNSNATWKNLNTWPEQMLAVGRFD